MSSFSITVTKNLSERRGAKSSEMSPVPMRSIGQTTKAHQHQQNRMSQVLQVPTVNLYPSRKKGLTKDHVTFSEYLQLSGAVCSWVDYLRPLYACISVSHSRK